MKKIINNTDSNTSKVRNISKKIGKYVLNSILTFLFLFTFLFSNYIYIVAESGDIDDSFEYKKSSKEVKYENIGLIYSQKQLEDLQKDIHTNNKFINVYEFTNKAVIKYYGNVWYTVDINDDGTLSDSYYMEHFMTKLMQEFSMIILTIVIAPLTLFLLIKLRKSVIVDTSRINLKIKYSLAMGFFLISYIPLKINEFLGYINSNATIFIAMGMWIIIYYIYVFTKSYKSIN